MKTNYAQVKELLDNSNGREVRINAPKKYIDTLIVQYKEIYGYEIVFLEHNPFEVPSGKRNLIGQLKIKKV